MAGARRGMAAAFDLATNTLESWDPKLDVAVLAMEPHEGKLFVGGAFTRSGAQARQFAAAFDAASGSLLPFAPSIGLSRVNLASLDVCTNEVSTWAPPNYGVTRCLTTDNSLLVAGFSSALPTVLQMGLARFAATPERIANPLEIAGVRRLVRRGRQRFGWLATGKC